MNTITTSWLVVMLASTVFAASLGGHPMTSYGGGQLPALERHTRNAEHIQRLLDEMWSLPRLIQLKNEFQKLDNNDDGKSTAEEIKGYLQKFNKNVGDDFVREFIARRDSNGNGKIDFIPDYLKSLKYDNTPEAAREWFTLHDANKDGIVSLEELMAPALAMGAPPEEARNYVRGYYMMFDDDHDDRLNFDEFKKLYG